ncbi:MAG: phosphoglycerate mutase family protein [Candidatus Paceibacterota bacterium]|jgi:broad specificity phosphatase PhoE
MSNLPNSIVLVRHGESEYNILAARKKADPLYQKFVQQYNRSMTSRRTRDLAEKVQEKFAAKWGDHDTPLTPNGIRQANVTGQKLGLMMPPPDIIFCSPYLRTLDTLKHLKEGWPKNAVVSKGEPGHQYSRNSCEISNVEVVEDILLREQNYGVGILYNDWRVFQALNPKQKILRDLNKPYWWKYPQGESMADTQLRDKIFWIENEERCAGKDILIVSHHRFILADVANKENLKPEQVLALDKESPPLNCGITTYSNVNGKLELECYNKKIWE